uniref:Aconitase/3-isopropylmalate dehydratase large subunit alpha/beta/alpha domain-containing protein n=1 Tax=Lactuca sativa TaxID=4236 RepID=A0A9R1V3G6_LACSA|nr:hypothetical protein LSAT_V11C700348120 [Lactuca sativa]
MVAKTDYKGVCHVFIAQKGLTWVSIPIRVLLERLASLLPESEALIPNLCYEMESYCLRTKNYVPPTLRFVLDGEMPNYLLAKDLILQIIGEISIFGATYKGMEFVGSTIGSLTVNAFGKRLTCFGASSFAGTKAYIIYV